MARPAVRVEIGRCNNEYHTRLTSGIATSEEITSSQVSDRVQRIRRDYPPLYTRYDIHDIATWCNCDDHYVMNVLSGNSVSNPVLQMIIEVAKDKKQKGLRYPDWRHIPTKDYSQMTIAFTTE